MQAKVKKLERKVIGLIAKLSKHSERLQQASFLPSGIHHRKLKRILAKCVLS